MSKVLLLDNYDSFTYNLYQYLSELGADVYVFKNDEITLSEIDAMDFSHIVISPGPGTPHKIEDIGVCGDVIAAYYLRVPILGVCLGCQLISVVFGGKVVNSGEIIHGMRSRININFDINNLGIFEGIESEFEAMRYHSLVIDEDTLPECLEVTARSDSGLIMAIEHKEAPLFGVQFHPESIGTEDGHDILKNFLSSSNV